VEVRPAALKNEEAQKAREQHADNRAGVALAGYDVTVLHGHQYYAFDCALSTSRPAKHAQEPSAQETWSSRFARLLTA
jgi:hypothetical protein